MPPTNSLINSLEADFPQLCFVQHETCRWSPDTQTVYYAALKTPENNYTLLHELAHGSLEHRDFTSDIDLLRKEVEAWQYAKDVLGKTYGIEIPDDFIDDSLETYRIWIHNRSLCPNCNQNGMQTKNDTYECLNCRCRWRVNDARQCQLKRYITAR